jgi:hypothetical protein
LEQQKEGLLEAFKIKIKEHNVGAEGQEDQDQDRQDSDDAIIIRQHKEVVAATSSDSEV